MMAFAIGTSVRLKRRVADGDKGVAFIKAFYPDIKGGVMLSRELNRFRSWNIDDLVEVRS